jgi:hypothetical protein
MIYEVPPQDRERISSFRDEIVSAREAERLDTFADWNWLSIPFEIATLLDLIVAENLCRVAQRYQQTATDAPVFWAADLDFHNGFREGAEDLMGLPAIPDSLDDWSFDYDWSDWLIVPQDLSFALICYGILNYDVALGPRDIIEQLVGMRAEEAIMAFKAFDDRRIYLPDQPMQQKELRMARALLEKERN